MNSCGNVNRVPVQISPVCDCVAYVDPNTEADSSISRLLAVVDRNSLLHLHRAAYRPIDAVEHNQQRIAPSLDDPATMLLYGGVYQVSTERPKTIQRSCIV